MSQPDPITIIQEHAAKADATADLYRGQGNPKSEYFHGMAEGLRLAQRVFRGDTHEADRKSKSAHRKPEEEPNAPLVDVCESTGVRSSVEGQAS